MLPARGSGWAGHQDQGAAFVTSATETPPDRTHWQRDRKAAQAEAIKFNLMASRSPAPVQQQGRGRHLRKLASLHDEGLLTDEGSRPSGQRSSPRCRPKLGSSATRLPEDRPGTRSSPPTWTAGTFSQSSMELADQAICLRWVSRSEQVGRMPKGLRCGSSHRNMTLIPACYIALHR